MLFRHSSLSSFSPCALPAFFHSYHPAFHTFSLFLPHILTLCYKDTSACAGNKLAATISSQLLQSPSCHFILHKAQTNLVKDHIADIAW